MRDSIDEQEESLVPAALKASVVWGSLFATLDIIRRAIALDISWYEAYLCYLVPVLILAVLFLFCTLLVRVAARFAPDPPEQELFAVAFSVVGFLICLCALLDILLVILLPVGARLSTYHLLQSMLLLITVGALILFRSKLAGTLAALRSFPGRFLRSPIGSNTALMVFVFISSLFAYDLWQYTTVPKLNQPKREEKLSQAPNILMIVLDTLRSDHLSAYGYQRDTSPFLEEYARTGKLFRNAYAVTSWTLPSHASLFTGQYPRQHGAILPRQFLDDSTQTLAEALAEKGYKTAGVVGNPYCHRKYGLGQGFQYYHDRMDFVTYRSRTGLIQEQFEKIIGFVFDDDNTRTAEEVSKTAKHWLQKNAVGEPAEEPFFLFMNYFDVHQPYEPIPSYRDRYTKHANKMDAVNDYINFHLLPERRFSYRKQSPEFIDAMKGLYDAEIRYLDDQLRAFFEWLEEKGVLENTLVIITSDHGEEFFEHGGVDHLMTIHEEVVRVPMILNGPMLSQAEVVESPVSLIDVVPTIEEVLGVTLLRNVVGESLLSPPERLSSRSILLERFSRKFYEENYLGGLIVDGWKVILSRPEQGRLVSGLYDISSDPLEQKNLVTQLPGRLRELLEQLAAFPVRSSASLEEQALEQ